MENIADLLQSALRCCVAGDLRQAEQLYRQILQGKPNHPEALFRLGVIAVQSNQPAAAVQFLTAAIRLDGSQAVCHQALGDALFASGRQADSIPAYRQAIRLDPNLPEVHNSLGAALQGQGDLAAAADSYRRAIERQPANGVPRYNLATVLRSEGRLDEALEQFSEAGRLRPDDPDSQLRVGHAFQLAGKYAEAARSFEAVARLRPEWSQGHSILGFVYQAQNRLEAAADCYRRAIELDPANVEARSNLGTALSALGRVSQAIECYQQALAYNPKYAIAHMNLAEGYLRLGRPDESAAAARRAVELEPNSAKAFAHLGDALRAQGETAGAIVAYRRVIELRPGDVANHSNLLYALNCRSDLAAATLFAEHRAWAERHAEPLTAAAPPHPNDRAPERRLRVGYVSAHFFSHAVSFFSEPLIAAHDRRQVEVFCYSDVRRADAVTRRFQAAADHWRETAGQSDETLAAQVRADQIDILVDLAGHIGGNRLLTFARKPAPVQVTYLGYQNTTSMSAMDYRLSDAHADPPGATDAYYTEQLVRLPGSFFCYRPPEPVPAVNELPALSAGHVTFGSLNHVNKLTSEAFEAWAQILRAVSHSRLILLAYTPGQLERNVRAVLARAGVGPERLEVVNRQPHYEYLRLYGRVDIALDTFRFNGHTTVCDALWMGVPSIMLVGDSYASRFGSSALVSLGLQELIGSTPDEYVAIATGLAGDVGRLSELRRSLRGRMQSSSLVDAGGFARHVENAYRQLWRRWCGQ